MRTNWREKQRLALSVLAAAALVLVGTPALAAEPTTIRINEIESNGGTPGDWVELVNTGSATVDLSGWIVKDNDDTHVFTIAAGVTIAGGAFLAVDVEVAFGLGGADSARLFQADGATLVDTYSWTAHASASYGRCPDGSGAFAATTTSTRGAANDCGSAAPAVKINEIESNGGTPGDWIELVNTGSATVDLSGWVFKDNDDTHVFTIAAGSLLAPGSLLTLDVDPVFGLGSADSARLYGSDGVTLIDTYSWTSHAATTYGRCPHGAGPFIVTTSSTRNAVNDCGAPVRISEIESNGGMPGDWIELVNNGSATVDLSGWILKDNDDTHVFTIPAATTLAGGAFVAFDVDPAFGLGGADSARLFQADGASLVDSYSWTSHAATTYGRCPDSAGAFTTTTVATKAAANVCPGQIPAVTWPGGSAFAIADEANILGGNMSGLAYQGGGVLWAVKNGPGALYRLRWDGAKWTPDTNDGWGAGKALHYPNGAGDLDAEGVTLTSAGPAGGVFVSTERDNAAGGVSRPEIIRFDPSAAGASLNATMEWNLTTDLPSVAANSGLEGISWIADSFLTANGFFDEHTGAAYDPSSYPGHGGGLFFVGLEANGAVYAYALDQTTGGFTRVATFASGFPGVMDLEFEPETGRLWAVCDDTCNGRTATLKIDPQGRFAVTEVYERPTDLPNLNNEGFAIAPQSECVAGRKPVFWADDSNTGGNALRSGTITCTDLDADDDGIHDTVDPQPTDPANETFTDALTTGRIVNRAGRTVSVIDAAGAAGVRVDVGPGTLPALVQLAPGTGAIALGQGSYELTGEAFATTLRVLDGGPAVSTVSVRATPITISVPAGGSVTYTEVTTANGAVTGLTGIQSTGAVTVRAAGMATNACAAIAVQNVVVGVAGNEQLTGTQGNDLILGLGGNDIVTGNGGSDCVITGAGSDIVTTTDGDDWIDAGGGNNVINAGGGANVVVTASGNDQITVGDGDDRVEAGGGNNVIKVAGGDNAVTSLSGNDLITSGAGNDVISAGNGNNSVNTGAGDDRITTGSGNDSVDCGDGADTANVAGGNNANVNVRCETFGA